MLKEDTTAISAISGSGPEASALLSHGYTEPKQHKSSPWCEHCRKNGHMKDKFWNLHGKPADWKPRKSARSHGYHTEAVSEK